MLVVLSILEQLLRLLMAPPATATVPTTPPLGDRMRSAATAAALLLAVFSALLVTVGFGLAMLVLSVHIR